MTLITRPDRATPNDVLTEGPTDGRTDTDCRFVGNYVESKAIFKATLVAGIFCRRFGDGETDRRTDRHRLSV